MDERYIGSEIEVTDQKLLIIGYGKLGIPLQSITSLLAG